MGVDVDYFSHSFIMYWREGMKKGDEKGNEEEEEKEGKKEKEGSTSTG